ncbi:ABC transporter substrate-binding protein [Paenibacillus montanisoli]|uniref:Carbohydrate ABC transporter substrate-binding protein n=1 Tax=Paenibacillus montanisoli TaxID=2081970 RepID=A0A328U2E5_9BACL|nr:extracellular solute-binding protein [Paenibacillus montanisoli]RAP76958.1 hypothetical protein DL346_00145 [Paenibacillus montanisoli]
MRKTWTAMLSCVLLFCLFLTACGGNNNGGDNTASGNDAANKPANNQAADSGSENTGGNEATSDVAGANDEAFTIRVGAWFIDQRTFMKEFVANVEKKYKELYPNATIQWDILLDAKYFDKLKAELASNTAPDVFFQQGLTSTFAEGNYLVDLSDQEWASKLHPGSVKFSKYDGNVYSAPMGVGTSGVWYNKKIFSDLGLEAPKTWDEFMQACEKIKAAGITPIALGFKDMWTAQVFAGLMIQSAGFESSKSFGKDLYDGAKKLDGPEMQGVMTKFQTMVESGYFNKSALSLDWPQSAEMFTTGKAAMIVQGPWMPGVAEDNFKTKGHAAFDLGYFPLMTDAGYHNLAVSVDQNLSINKSTKLLQQAKDLVSVILSPEIYGPYNVGNGNIPAISGIEVNYPNPVFNEVKTALAEGESSGGFEGYIATSAYTALAEEVTKIVSGAKFNPDDLKEAQSKQDKDKSTIILPSE